MSEARLLDGKATARAVREDVARAVARLVELGVRPGLAVVLVGDDPASQVYVRNKDRAATEAGIEVTTVRLDAATPREAVLERVRALGADPAVHGILVQLPLPAGLSAEEVIAAIPPAKDVDGLTAENVAALVLGREGLVPCTPAGCLELLDRHGIGLAGREVVVIGRSMLVGKPFALLASCAATGSGPGRPCSTSVSTGARTANCAATSPSKRPASGRSGSLPCRAASAR